MAVKVVTDYLDESAKCWAKKMAFIDKKRGLTFSELRLEARKVASLLAESKVWHSAVVIYLDKSVECIAAFIGTAYSGNFYTPIDTTMPKARVEKILETLQPTVVITDVVHKSLVEEWSSASLIITYEDAMKTVANEALLDECRGKIIDTDVLYVLFTSGSTGNPKGVIIGNRSVVDYTEWVADTFDLDETNVIGNQAPLFFDLSVQDIYATLKTGCTTYLLDEREFSFPIKLMKSMEEKKIDTIFWVPSALCMVANLKALHAKSLPPLKNILFCGEVMPTKQLNIWKKAFPKAIFVNLYGPTEITEVCTYFIINRDFDDREVLPIGIPCRNTDVLVLNSNDKLAEKDEIGELCVRGTSLAYGYYNNYEKTAEAFVQNPLQTAYPETIYRTGDLVKYNDNGELVYICRKDFQIKHMGHRIELGEIEAAASSIDGVDINCCLYDKQHDRIVLFYTGGADTGSVGEKLRNLLPGYMLPNKRVKLSDIPLNSNGKINRLLLKEKISE